MYNNHSVITEPLTEWITLTDAKEWLKIDFTGDDALITALVPAARKAAEHYTRRKILDSSIIESWSTIPGEMIVLYWSELISVESVKYRDEDDTEQTIDPGDYIIATTYRPPFIMFTSGYEIPSTSVRPDAFTITYKAGYVDAASIPEDMVTAMKLILTDMYENRTDRVHKMPTASEYLLRPYYILEA